MHIRPEDSTSALSSGINEEDEIRRLRQALSPDVELVLKEHPYMLGFRSRKFYKSLKDQKGVTLIDPGVPTMEVVQKSSGVAGLSGTVLLEAALVGRPTLALGQPEFSLCLTSNGWGEADAFFKLVNMPDPDLDQGLLEKYLALILRKSDSRDLPFLSDLSSHEGKAMIESVSSRFWSAYQEETVGSGRVREAGALSRSSTVQRPAS